MSAKHKINSDIKKTVAIIIAVLLGFSVFFSSLYIIFERGVNADKKLFVEQLTAAKRDSIEKLFSRHFDTLTIISDSIMAHASYESPQNAAFLEKIISSTSLKSAGAYFLTNAEYSTDAQSFTNGNREYFVPSLAGERFISHSIPDDIDNEMINFLSVPLYYNKMVCGVLYAKIRTSDIDEAYLSHGVAGDEKIYILDDNLRSYKPDETNAPDEIFSHLPNNKKAKAASALSQKDFEPYVIFDENDIICYASIANTNFRLLLTIESSKVSRGSQNIAMGFLLLLLAASLVFITLLWHAKLTYNKSKLQAKSTSAELETVISGISGGVVRFAYNANLTIEFLNDGLLLTSGYSRNELHLLLSNSFANFLHYDDRPKLEQVVMRQFDGGDPLEITCRMLNKIGTYSWFLIRGKQVTDDSGKKSCLCVLTDITTMKKAEHELSQTMQRYSIVISQSDSIIFEYNFNDDSIYLSSRWSEKFSFPANTPMFFDRAVSSGFVHRDDAGKIASLFERVKRGTQSDSVEVRLLGINDQYIWCRIKSSAIFDEDGKVYKTVGKFTDIDKQFRTTENLKQMAELDALTEIYNKGTVFTTISALLDNSRENEKHALMILDIDNFKSINDTVGHLGGDATLKDLSRKMKSLLRSTDICGRIGGDEFVVLLRDVHGIDEIKQRANELCDAFRDTICIDGKTVRVSCSIGISVRSESVNDYTTMFEKADVALYESKRNGKNQITVYGEWIAK